MALKAYKISLSYLSELISYFSISPYPSNWLHFSYNSCLILNRDGKQRIRTFSYSRTLFSQVHKGEIPHNLQMFTQIPFSSEAYRIENCNFPTHSPTLYSALFFPFALTNF